MSDLNLTILTGNLCRDPEVKTFQNGTRVTNFTLACNDDYKKKSGEEVKQAHFIDVSCFGGTADFVSQNAKKGAKLFVQGKLTLDTWQDKATGQKRSKLKVTATRVQLFGQAKPAQDRPATNQNDEFADVPEEDIPF